MKIHLIFLVVLAFAVGMFAGEKKYYYRVDTVDANTLLVACTEDRPFTTMRLDDVLEVHCRTPKAKP